MSLIMWLFFKRKELVEFSCGTSQAFAYGYNEKFVPRFHHVLDDMIFPPFFHAVCNS